MDIQNKAIEEFLRHPYRVSLSKLNNFMETVTKIKLKSELKHLYRKHPDYLPFLERIIKVLVVRNLGVKQEDYDSLISLLPELEEYFVIVSDSIYPYKLIETKLDKLFTSILVPFPIIRLILNTHKINIYHEIADMTNYGIFTLDTFYNVLTQLYPDSTKYKLKLNLETTCTPEDTLKITIIQVKH